MKKPRYNTADTNDLRSSATRRRFVIGATGLTIAAMAGCTDNGSGDEADTEGEAEAAEGQNTEETSGDDPVVITINYRGEWAGNVGHQNRQVSVDGRGRREVTIDGVPPQITATVQKQDDGTGELHIEIEVEGETIASQGTTAEFGTVSLSAQP